uniref:Putative secreted protein n=1 Tax=Anopheles darlingi TaxID=43151 RepID=A0A2M4D0B3_ANODA
MALPIQKLQKMLFLQLLLMMGWPTLITPHSEGSTLSRQKRFLIFPRANPGRLQLIGGFGIPVDIQLESITVGYVIKTVYYLPWNSSHLIPPFLDRHEADGLPVAPLRNTRSIPLVLAADRIERYEGILVDKGTDSLPKPSHAESRWMFYRAIEQMFEQLVNGVVQKGEKVF